MHERPSRKPPVAAFQDTVNHNLRTFRITEISDDTGRVDIMTLEDMDDGSDAHEPDMPPDLDDVFAEVVELRHELRALRVLVEHIYRRGIGPA